MALVDALFALLAQAVYSNLNFRRRFYRNTLVTFSILFINEIITKCVVFPNITKLWIPKLLVSLASEETALFEASSDRATPDLH